MSVRYKCDKGGCQQIVTEPWLFNANFKQPGIKPPVSLGSDKHFCSAECILKFLENNLAS